MTNIGNLDAVNKGDIVLFLNDAEPKYSFMWMIIKLIETLDNTPYSHAGIYVQKKEIKDKNEKAKYIPELDGATLSKGLIRHAIPLELWVGESKILVKRIQKNKGDINNVMSVAEEYIKNSHKYAVDQAILAGILCLTRPLPQTLKAPASYLLNLLSKISEEARQDGKNMMTCSSFVYRCYKEAGIEILPDNIQGVASNSLLEKANILLQNNSERSFMESNNDKVVTLEDAIIAMRSYVGDIENDTVAIQDVMEISDDELFRTGYAFMAALTDTGTLSDRNIEMLTERINANFVTPGDIWRHSINLDEIGTWHGPNQ